MSFESGKVTNVPVAHINYNDTTNGYEINYQAAIKVPNDYNDHHILCPAKDLRFISKKLHKIKDKIKEDANNSLKGDVCGAVATRCLGILGTLWMGIDPYSLVGFWIHIILLIITGVTSFYWYIFRNRSGINIDEQIEEILDTLPNPETAKILNENKNNEY